MIMALQLILLFLPLMFLVGGSILLWRGLTLTSDKAWKEHVERCAAQGLLRPERNAYWERSVRWGRIVPTAAGIAFLCMGVFFSYRFLSDPLLRSIWW